MPFLSDEIGGCTDRAQSESKKSSEFSEFWNRTISYSDQACQQNEDSQKIGQTQKFKRFLINSELAQLTMQVKCCNFKVITNGSKGGNVKIYYCRNTIAIKVD